jgi:DNA-binding response OmpR family regulator
MKILYLEDDVALSATIEEFLTDQGYDVVTAFSGNDVLEYSYDEVFDLFIFDV